MKTKNKLLASSNTMTGIIECMEAFWFRKDITVDDAGNVFLNGKHREGVKITKKGKRYRFEMVRS